MYCHVQSHLAMIVLSSDSSQPKKLFIHLHGTTARRSIMRLFFYLCILTTTTGNFVWCPGDEGLMTLIVRPCNSVVAAQSSC